jgi:hypothetical protein
MESSHNNVVIVKERPQRRRFAGLLGCATLGAALIAGATLASFTDSEYGRFGGEGDGDITTANYNIQIAQVGEGAKGATGTWHDTTMKAGNASDNTAADVESPLQLTLSGTGLAPGNADAKYTASFDVRNAPGSAATDLSLYLLDQSGADTATQALLDNLLFDVVIKDKDNTKVFESTTPLSFDDITDPTKAIVVGENVTPNTYFSVTITIHLDEDADNTVRGGKANLIAQIDGSSTVTSA